MAKHCSKFLILSFAFLFLVLLQSNSSSAEKKEKLSIVFDNADTMKQWQNIDDVVMGGVSKSQLSRTENKTALFKGKVSLENYGGFSSVFFPLTENDLSGYSGIELKVKGDGKKYKFYCKNVPNQDSVSYEGSLGAEKDVWKTVQIPFSSLVPKFRGQVLTDAPKFDSHNVKSIGILISEKQEGPFQLEIEYIKGYK